MERTVVLLWITVVGTSLFLGVDCQTNFTEEWTLTLVNNTNYGVMRMASGWTDRSLIGCARTCRDFFSSQCQSVMYNRDTKLCTPASYFKKNDYLTYSAPSAAEGQLYASARCDTRDDFTLLSSGSLSACVMVSKSYAFFGDARDYCEGIGSALFWADSLDKINLLPHGNDFIVGLTDLDMEDTFIWGYTGEIINGTFRDEFFYTGQPDNNGGSEHCVTVNPGRTGPGEDIDCNQPNLFVCERPVIRL